MRIHSAGRGLFASRNTQFAILLALAWLLSPTMLRAGASVQARAQVLKVAAAPAAVAGSYLDSIRPLDDGRYLTRVEHSVAPDGRRLVQIEWVAN